MTTTIHLLAILMLSATGLCICKLGIDTADSFNDTDIDCLVANNISNKLYWRGYKSTGVIDKVGVANLALAVSRGITTTSVYMNPNPSGDAAKEADEICSYLSEQITSYSFRIIVRLTRGDRWSSDISKNRAFVLNLTKAISDDRRCYGVGFYTSKLEFESLFGGDFTALKGRFLMIYINRDNDPVLHNFRSFGGWTSPLTKEYTEDTHKFCGKTVKLLAMVCKPDECEEEPDLNNIEVVRRLSKN